MNEWHSNNKISALINLLEDENNDIATSAMSELLSCKKEITSVVSELQESSNLLIRRRIHQMQGIIKTRNNRDKLSRRFHNNHSGLWQGLNELHLLWYDNDNIEMLRGLRKELFEKAAIIKPSSGEKLAELMRAMAFSCSGKGNIEPDYYCIGSVLETKVGADFIICSIAQVIGSYYGWKGEIVYNRKDGHMLLDNSGYRILPKTWSINKATGNKEYEVWTTGMLLKHTAFHLYLCAISSDSIRYVYTIGLCLAKMLGKDGFQELLPYPFNSTDRTFKKYSG
jgi:hypothetical protein